MFEKQKFGLSKMSPKTSFFIKTWQIYERVNALIYAAGSMVILLLGVITVFDVGGRYLFSHPLLGALELSELAMATVIFLCFGYSITLKAHINVDILTIRMPLRAKVIFQILSNTLCLIFLTVLITQSARIAIEQRGNYSDTLEIPTFFFALLVPFGTSLGVISLIGLLIKDILSLMLDKRETK